MFELLGRYKIGLPSQGKDPENEVAYGQVGKRTRLAGYRGENK